MDDNVRALRRVTVPRRGSHGFVVPENGPAVRLDRAGNNPHERRFSAAVGADPADLLARGKGETRRLKHGPWAVVLGDVTHFKQKPGHDSLTSQQYKEAQNTCEAFCAKDERQI